MVAVKELVLLQTRQEWDNFRRAAEFLWSTWKYCCKVLRVHSQNGAVKRSAYYFKYEISRVSKDLQAITENVIQIV